jgi:formate dehydrogenase major subunit
MEKPNKWAASETEAWVPTACAYCSVGCTISLGVKKGRGVIVRPDPANPVSRDQLCVRGRFHYDSVKYDQRLEQPLVRRDGELAPASWDGALDAAATRLAGIAKAHGPGAIGFVGSPFATNEENYLLSKLARAAVGSNNIDTTTGSVMGAAASVLRRAFGTEVLPADMTVLAQANTVLVVADDLESSHNVACLRVKDAVVGNGARLVVVTPRWRAATSGGLLRPRRARRRQACRLAGSGGATGRRLANTPALTSLLNWPRQCRLLSPS